MNNTHKQRFISVSPVTTCRSPFFQHGECLYSPLPGFVYTAGESIFIFTLSLPSSSPPSLSLLPTLLHFSSGNVHDHSTKKVFSVSPVGTLGGGGRGYLLPDVFKALATLEMMYFPSKQEPRASYKTMTRDRELDEG